jgi:hypothetical protein
LESASPLVKLAKTWLKWRDKLSRSVHFKIVFCRHVNVIVYFNRKCTFSFSFLLFIFNFLFDEGKGKRGLEGAFHVEIRR